MFICGWSLLVVFTALALALALALAKLPLALPLRSYGFTFLFPATYGFDFRFYQDIRLNKGTPAGCYSGSSKPHVAPVLLVLSIASKP
jgi:hypothetical protein